MIKFTIAFMVVWILVYSVVNFIKFSDNVLKVKVLKALAWVGFIGFISGVILFFVVQLF